MLNSLVISNIKKILQILNRPLDVLLICLAVSFFVLVIEGGLFQLIELYRDSERLEAKILTISKLNEGMAMKIRRTSDLDFIEFEARSRFDLVGKNDLVFIFSDFDEEDEIKNKRTVKNRGADWKRDE